MQKYEHVAPRDIKSVGSAVIDVIRRPIKRAAGFDYHMAAKQLRGPVIEVDGPEPRGYPLINHAIPSPVHPASLSIHGLLVLDSASPNGPPMRPGSVGMVLASHVSLLEPQYLGQSRDEAEKYLDLAMDDYEQYQGPGGFVRMNRRLKLIEAVGRVLEPNGMLVMQGCSDNDVRAAGLNGMEPRMWRGSQDAEGAPMPYGECVLQRVG